MLIALNAMNVILEQTMMDAKNVKKKQQNAQNVSMDSILMVMNVIHVMMFARHVMFQKHNVLHVTATTIISTKTTNVQFVEKTLQENYVLNVMVFHAQSV